MDGTIIGTVIGILGAVVGCVAYFYKTKEELKKEISSLALSNEKTKSELKSELHNLELKIKDLEHKDAIQQITLDQIPNVFGVINRLLDQNGSENGNRK